MSKLDLTRDDDDELVSGPDPVVVRHRARKKRLELGTRPCEDVQAEDGQAINKDLPTAGTQLQASSDRYKLEPVRSFNCDPKGFQSAHSGSVERYRPGGFVGRIKLVEGVGR
jgi:hypothetical protein